MACSQHTHDLMHKFLDGDMLDEEEKGLRSHLQSCSSCQQHFRELKRTDTLLKSSSELQASTNFTDKVMTNLPKEKKSITYMRKLKAHPLLTAAAIFFLFMFGGIFSIWDQDNQLSVSKDKNLIIEDDTVIVPEGVIVEGDLVVKNGNLRINGSVHGDVVIINGEHLMASAGDISGEIQQVNQVFEWMWYHIKAFTQDIFTFSIKLPFVAN